MLSDFSNFGSLKSTEIPGDLRPLRPEGRFSNFGSLKSTEIFYLVERFRNLCISAISAR